MLMTLYFPVSVNSDSIEVPLVAFPNSPSLRCSQAYARHPPNYKLIKNNKYTSDIIQISLKIIILDV